ncbi:MAG: PLP-dependent aminotransferase family protein, partial [Verrucomicrobia bacterium]
YPREGICLDELEKRLKCCRIKACVFTLNFSNPLGSCMPDEKKKRLVQMLTEHEVPLIEDDIYGNLSFAPKRPKSAKAFDTEGWVMSCDSLSKTLAPGFRIGWVAPGRFKTRVEFLKLVTTHSTASPTQLAMAEYLRNGGYENHLRKLRKLYATQAARMGEAVSRHFPEGTKVSRPTGGMALWVEMPESIHALEVYQRALAEKICVAPGPIFSAKQGFQNCLRLNYANPWSDSIERALVKLGQIIATLGGKGRS